MRSKSPVSYMLWDENATGGEDGILLLRNGKFCDMKIEIAAFVINESVKLTVPPDRQK